MIWRGHGCYVPYLISSTIPRLIIGTEADDDSDSASVMSSSSDDAAAYDRGDIDEDFEKEYSSLLQASDCAAGAGRFASGSVAIVQAVTVQALIVELLASQDLQGRPAPAATTPAIGLVTRHKAAAHDAGSITFKLLMKRGGREEVSRELEVPASADMARMHIEREQSEAEEKAAIKQLVLAANTRDEEEELEAASTASGGKAKKSGHRSGRGGGYSGRGQGRLGPPSMWGL